MNLGAFELRKAIGEGGMGTVWLAEHGEAEIDVAVKVMRSDVMDDPDYREAFELEVRSVASLDHPNIVTILDFGQIPPTVSEEFQQDLVAGSPYLVMEFAQGGAVDDYFHRLRWPDVRELMIVILDALSHAHARNVIHRDLKPENILVGCGPQWDVKLTDFGLAHAADRFQDSGDVEVAWGTPQYMAPEQIRGYWREYGPWTDLYGLGCMAYELICGELPYDGETIWQIGQGHIEEPIPPLNPRFAVPEGTEEWIRKLMAKQRANRFRHAADAKYELAQLPSLEEEQGFGVLFEPPTSKPSTTESKVTGEVATQLMPELTSAKSFCTVQYSPPDLIGGSEPDRRLSAQASLAAQAPPVPMDWRHRRESTISNALIGISTGLFGLRSIPLVDRNPERDWLWSLLRDIHDDNRGKLCVVEGAAGTGKSQLVRWLCRRAKEVGAARVLKAYHSPRLGRADGLVPMMERFLRSTRLDPEKRRNHLGDLLLSEGLAGHFELSALLTLFDDDSSPSSARQQNSREESYAVIYRYLSLLARRRPIIIWLDDVQWSLDTLGFARYVLRQQEIEPAPLLVVMTARTEALGERDRERRVLHSLVADEAVDRRQLEPLEEDDIDRLVRRLLRLDDALAEHVIARSEGVPLFAVQLVEDWVARGKLMMGSDGFVLKPDADVSIPDDLHELWDRRIQGFLGEEVEHTVGHLELAAILGQEVDSEEWNKVIDEAGLQPAKGLVERLVDEDLAEPMEDGWRFSHGLLAESLQRHAREEGRGKRWNACCAQALEQLYGRSKSGISERIAWHWVEAAEYGRALNPLGRAIDEAIERSQFDHAGALIEWRAGLFDNSAPHSLQTAIDEARLACYRGDYKVAVELGKQAATEAHKEGGWPQLAARANLWVGVAQRFIGELDAAEANLQSAGEYFADAGHNARLARTVLELGRVEERRGDYEMARRHFEGARERFSEGDDSFGEAQCFNALGDVLRQSGEYDAAHSACLKALKRFRAMDNVAGIADCLNDLAEWSRLRGDLSSAGDFAEEALRLYRALGSGLEHFVRLNLAMILLEKRSYAEAEELFASLVEVFQQTEQRALASQARAGLLAANAGQSRWANWEEMLQKIMESADETGASLPMATRALTLAFELAQQAGKTDLATSAEKLVIGQRRKTRSTMEVGDMPDE